VLLGRPSAVEDERRVVVTASDIEQLRAGWFRLWQRAPTDAELQAQLEQFVRDEVLYREAVRRGYDQGDRLVRHTMKLKMEFLGEAQVQQTEPSAEEIRAYYAMRKDRYRVPGKVSFVHVYLSRDQRGTQAEADAARTLEKLIADEPDLDKLSGYGDRFMLKDHYVGQDERQLLAEFGESFASRVISLEVGAWQGPIESAYGSHLVNVYDREASYLPEIAEIEEKIRNDMQYEAREAAKDTYYTEILRDYEIAYDADARTLLGEK
jgi:parvulin-like peptidyl-prolyl isomerase